MSHLVLDRPTPTRAAATSTVEARVTAPRLDLYAPIHKALRLFLGDTLARVGRLDVHDAAELTTTLGQLDALLDLCTSHVAHENDFVHPAIEARAPGGASTTAADHEEHLLAIGALRRATTALRAAPTDASALQLYRQLALFVAENLQHMHIEETVNNAALWAHHDDAELLALHDRLLASIPPHEHAQVARWMLPALTPAERAAVVGGMRAQMPAPAFDALLATLRERLDAIAWRKLAQALAIAPVPGLVECV